MRIRSVCWLLALGLATQWSPARAADAFAPVGANAVLSVEYLYESVGRKQNNNDLREWHFKRRLSLVADLASQSPTPVPTMQAFDAKQTAKLNKQSGQMQKLATEMAPMRADIGKIMAKCGNDEKCVEREVMKMGAAMAGTPQADAMLKSGQETAAAAQPGAARYQLWYATAQKGTYAIDETAHSVIADPICQPSLHCTRNVVRQGSGDVPPLTATKKDVGLFYAAEVDAEKNTLTITLPVPVLPLSYTETITTDEPNGARDTPTPKGPRPKQMIFRTSADGNKPFTVALKNGWHTQSGEKVVRMKGDGGKLTVRWHFHAQ